MKKLRVIDQRRFSALFKSLYTQAVLSDEELKVLRELLFNFFVAVVYQSLEVYPQKTLIDFVKEQVYLSPEDKMKIIKLFDENKLAN